MVRGLAVTQLEANVATLSYLATCGESVCLFRLA